MITAALRQVCSLGFWGGVCTLFSLFLASGNLLFGAAVLAAILVYGVALLGPHVISSLWLLGAPTVFGFANQYLHGQVPFITVERLLFVTLAGIICVRAVFLKGAIPRLTRLEGLMILFLGYASISLVATADNWRRDLWFLLQYAIPMVTFMLSRRMTWSEQGVKVFFASLTLTGVAMAAIGVMQWFFGLTIFNVHETIAGGHAERAYGMFTNAHAYGATLVIFLTLALFQFTLYKDGLARAALIVAMFAMIAGIIAGQTRAPCPGAALSLLIIFVRDRESRPLLLVGGAL